MAVEVRNTDRKYEASHWWESASRSSVCPMSGKDFKVCPTCGADKARRLYPVDDAAYELGVSSRKTWTLIYDGRLGTKILDGRRLVPASVLDEFVALLPDGEVAAA